MIFLTSDKIYFEANGITREKEETLVFVYVTFKIFITYSSLHASIFLQSKLSYIFSRNYNMWYI